MSLELRPVPVRAACDVWVRKLHRHLPRVVGGLFAVTVFEAGELDFEPRDLWVGVFWDYRRVEPESNVWDGGPWRWRLHVYICPLPTIVLRLVFR